jgi:hypothetical protein
MAFRYSGTGWRVAHSIKTFGDQIMDLRGHTNSYTVDGTLGNVEHSNRVSDHNPDDDGIVRALDFFEHVPGFVDEIAEALRTSKDPRLKYFIHDTRMFASYALPGKPAWEWREYIGANAHITHGHLSVVATNVADQTQEWELNVMTPAQEAKLDAVLAAVNSTPGAVLAAEFGGQIGSSKRKSLSLHILEIKSLIGVLDSEGVSEAELNEAADRIIALVPDEVLVRLKAKL